VIVHCGDIGQARDIETLTATGLPAYAVAGNTDHSVSQLSQAASRAGVNFSSEVVKVPLGDGRHLVASHGNDAAVVAELIQCGRFPYVCHGHAHRWRDERIGNVRVISPASLSRCRDPGYPTAALLDTETDTLEQITVPE